MRFSLYAKSQQARQGIKVQPQTDDHIGWSHSKMSVAYLGEDVASQPVWIGLRDRGTVKRGEKPAAGLHRD